MRRLRALAALAPLILVACSGGGGGGGGGPTTPTTPALSLTVSPGAISIQGSASVTVRVVSSTGVAIAGAVVGLQTDLGTLVDTAVTTGADGRAATTLRAGGTAGVATVRAQFPAGGVSASATLRIGQGSAVALRAAPDSIAATGTAEIFAVVTRLDGQSTPEGTVVDLATTLGRLSDPHPRTDRQGAVHVQLAGDGRTGTAHVTASTSDAVATAGIDVTIGGSAQIAVQTSPTAIPRDGAATLIAVVRDGTGAPVGAGVQVHFTTTRGRLDDAFPATDGLGQAITTLRADGSVGSATITAQANGGSGTAVLAIGQGLRLELRAAPTAIAADGAATVTLLALAPDNRSVPIGTGVTFQTTLGHLEVDHGTVAETGLATTILDGKGAHGTARITARVDGYTDSATLDVPIG